MKKIVLSLILICSLFINLNFVEAGTDVKTSCMTKCENDNLGSCNAICDQIDFCYNACIGYETETYCENQCYINHYPKPLVKEEETIKSSCMTKCENDDLGSCEARCDQIDFCYNACLEYEDSAYCESQCYGNHYYESYDKTDDKLSWNSKVQCGDISVPYMFPDIIHKIYTILKIFVPIIIVIFGSVDFLKAVMAQKEDEIKKGQSIFIRRLILGVCVFLVFAIVQFVIGIVAPQNQNENMWNCVECFINGKCQKN